MDVTRVRQAQAVAQRTQAASFALLNPGWSQFASGKPQNFNAVFTTWEELRLATRPGGSILTIVALGTTLRRFF
jgi:hypothetical protein